MQVGRDIVEIHRGAGEARKAEDRQALALIRVKEFQPVGGRKMCH